MTRPKLMFLLPLLLISSIFALPSIAHAKTSETLAFPYQHVWPATVRLLRVDQGYKLHDNDRDAGYVLFDYIDEGKTYRASVQLSRRKTDNGAMGTNVIFHITDRPAYLEQMLLNKLRAKLEDEGAPPAKKPPAEKPPEKDGDKNKKKDKDKDKAKQAAHIQEPTRRQKP